MDYSYVVFLGVFAVVALAGVICFFGWLRHSERVEVQRALAIEKEKTERYLQTEREKNAREEMRLERARVQAEADSLNARVEAGLLGGSGSQDSEDGGGLESLLSNPMVMQMISGFLASRAAGQNAGNPVSPGVQVGGDAGNPAAFPNRPSE